MNVNQCIYIILLLSFCILDVFAQRRGSRGNGSAIEGETWIPVCLVWCGIAGFIWMAIIIECLRSRRLLNKGNDADCNIHSMKAEYILEPLNDHPWLVNLEFIAQRDNDSYRVAFDKYEIEKDIFDTISQSKPSRMKVKYIILAAQPNDGKTTDRNTTDVEMARSVSNSGNRNENGATQDATSGIKLFVTPSFEIMYPW